MGADPDLFLHGHTLYYFTWVFIYSRAFAAERSQRVQFWGTTPFIHMTLMCLCLGGLVSAQGVARFRPAPRTSEHGFVGMTCSALLLLGRSSHRSIHSGRSLFVTCTASSILGRSDWCAHFCIDMTPNYHESLSWTVNTCANMAEGSRQCWTHVLQHTHSIAGRKHGLCPILSFHSGGLIWAIRGRTQP